MLSLSDSLQTKQVTSPWNPTIRLEVQEFDYPAKSDTVAVHNVFEWTRLNYEDKTARSENFAACIASDGSLNRLKVIRFGGHTRRGYHLYHQRVASFDENSDYSQWTLLDTFLWEEHENDPPLGLDIVASPTTAEVLIFAAAKHGYCASANYGATWGSWTSQHAFRPQDEAIKACYKPDTDDLIVIYQKGAKKNKTQIAKISEKGTCGESTAGYTCFQELSIYKRTSSVWSSNYDTHEFGLYKPELGLNSFIGIYYDDADSKWNIIFTTDLSWEGFAQRAFENSVFYIQFDDTANTFSTTERGTALIGKALALTDVTEYVQEALDLRPLQYKYNRGGQTEELKLLYQGLQMSIREIAAKPVTYHTVTGGISLIKPDDYQPILALFHSEKMYFYIMRRGTTFDEGVWMEAYTLDTTAPYGLTLQVYGDYVYGMADNQIWRSSIPEYWTPPTEGAGAGDYITIDSDDIVKVEENPDRRIDPPYDLEVVLDNSAGQYNTWGTGDLAILTRGARINLYEGFDGVYPTEPSAYYFIDNLPGYSHGTNRGYFNIHAIDGWGLLERYILPMPVNWELMSVAKILHPNGAGTTTQLTSTSAQLANWETVHRKSEKPEIGKVSGRRVYNATAGSYKYDTYALDNVTHAGRIDRVIIKATCANWMHSTYGDALAKTALRTYSTVYYGSAEYLFHGLRKIIATYTANPNTGLEWTWTEINDLEVGIALNPASVQVVDTENPGCYRLYGVVKCYSEDATIWDIIETLIEAIGGNLYYVTRSTAITTITPHLRISAGESAASVVRRLLALTGDVLYFRGNDGYIVNPLTTDTSNYSYLFQGD